MAHTQYLYVFILPQLQNILQLKSQMPSKKKTPSKTLPKKENSNNKVPIQKKQSKKPEIFDEASQDKGGKNTSELTPMPPKADESSSQSHIIRTRRKSSKKKDDIQYFPNKVQKLKKQKKQQKIQKKEQEKPPKKKFKESGKQIFKVKKIKEKEKKQTEKSHQQSQEQQLNKKIDNQQKTNEKKETSQDQHLYKDGPEQILNMKTDEDQRQKDADNAIDNAIQENQQQILPILTQAQPKQQIMHQIQHPEQMEDIELNNGNQQENGFIQQEKQQHLKLQQAKNNIQSQKSQTHNEKNIDIHKKKHKKHIKKPHKYVNEPLPPPTNATVKKQELDQNAQQSQLDQQHARQTILRQNDVLKQISLRCTQFFKDLSQFCYNFYKNMDKPQNNISKQLINFDTKKYKLKLLNKNELISSSPYVLTKKTNFQFRRKDYNDPNMPRRPMAAYILYFQQQKSGFMKEYPGRNLAEITKLIGKNWGKLTDEEKKKYLDTAAQDRRRYQNEMLTYRQNKAIEAGHDPNLIKLAKPRKKKPQMGIQQLLMKQKLTVERQLEKKAINEHDQSDQLDVQQPDQSHQQQNFMADVQFGEIPEQLQKQLQDKSP